MRRSDIVEGAKELLATLHQSDIEAALISRAGTKETDDERTQKTGAILKALNKYSIRASQFKPAARMLVDIFGLQILENTGRWLAIAERTPINHKVFSLVRNVTEFLPAIIKMIESESKRLATHEAGQRVASERRRLLTVMVHEPENRFSTPARLSNVLDSINDFYTACATLENASPSTLSVISLDSGSDKSFDFLGLATVMESVERLIVTIWDRAFFFREHQLEERMDLVAKSLPIIERIKKMEQEKLLEPEMAKLLTRNVFEGTNKFLISGATIPRIEDTTVYNPKALLSPIQKLLVAAPEDATLAEQSDLSTPQDQVTNESSRSDQKVGINNLSDAEQEQLLDLLQRSRVVKSTSDAITEIDSDVYNPERESKPDTPDVD